MAEADNLATGVEEKNLLEEFDLEELFAEDLGENFHSSNWLNKLAADDNSSCVSDDSKPSNLPENVPNSSELSDRKLKFVVRQLMVKIASDVKNVKQEIFDKLEYIKQPIMNSSDNLKMSEKNVDAEMKNNNNSSQQIFNINQKLADLSARLETMKMKDWARDITEMELRSKLYWVERYALSKNIVFNENPLQESYKNSKLIYTWTIPNVNEESLKDKNFKAESPVLPATGYPINTAKLQQNENSFSVYISIADNESLAKKKLYPKIDFVLKDQSGNARCLDIVQTCDLSQWSSFGFYQFVGPCVEFPLAKVLDPVYNGNSSIALEIYVEPQSMAGQAVAQDGVLHWTIDECKKRQDLEAEGLVKNHPSPYFYTSSRGFRMQAHLNFTGQEGVKVTIIFLSGEFDEELATIFDVSPEKLPGKAHVTLLNCKVPAKSITKSADIKIIGRFSVNICSQEELKDMIENDTLYCKITIV